MTVSDAGRTGAMTGAWLGGLLGQVMHKMQAEADANLIRIAAALDSPVPK